MLRILLVLFLMAPSIALADERIRGIWVNADDNIRLDILDGFKPNRGAILVIEDGTETSVGTWETTDSTTTLQIDWLSSPVTFWANDTFEWNNKGFKKQQEINEEDVILLRQDEAGFLHKLTSSVWLSSTEGQTSTFTSTFSTDSGVVEILSKEGGLDSLDSWGIASGVLKIGSEVIIAARASRGYITGLNERDNFVVFRSTDPVSPQTRADLANQRVEFLAQLVTDTWQQSFYGSYRDYKFRPIEGPFRGRRFYLVDDRLERFATWEYSPSTGAIKIGYTEYVGGLVIGNNLALLEEDGDQEFYRRKPGGIDKSFTVADVRTHAINETRGAEFAAILSGQFQKDSYLYSFEFNEDGRTGYMHEWRSQPFTITGHELAIELFREAENVFEVEDFVLFDDRFVLKRDATASRLRSKTQREILEDKVSMEERLQELGKTNLILRVRGVNGNSRDIVLPFSSLSEVSDIQIFAQ